MKAIFDSHIQKILSHISHKNSQTIIHIAGGSASGKTTLTQKLLQHFGKDDCRVISMDDYYHGGEFNNKNNISFDHEESFNIPLLEKHIKSLKNGMSIEKPIYCMKQEKPIHSEKIHPKKIIIIEGLYALHADLVNHADMSIFMESNTHIRFERRLERDKQRTLQTHEEIYTRFQIAEKLYNDKVLHTKKHAHLIIHN